MEIWAGWSWFQSIIGPIQARENDDKHLYSYGLKLQREGAFYQFLHCSPGEKRTSKKEKQFYLEIITYKLSIYHMTSRLGEKFMQ